MAEPAAFRAVPRAPVAPPPAAPAGVRGTLPMASGQLIAGDRLMPDERAALARLGWVEGAPVPVEMAAVLAAEHAAAARDVAGILPVPADTPPVAMQEVPLESLPPEHQARLRGQVAQMLEGARLQEQQARRAPGGFVPAPGVADALRLSSEMARSAPAAAPPEAAAPIRWRPQPAAPQAPPPPPPAPPYAPAPAPEPAPEPAAPARSGLGLAGCPNCGFDLAGGLVAEATPGDRLAYLAHVLGAPRFTREYALFGGRLAIVFRTLTSAESDLVTRQLQGDLKSGALADADAYYVRLFRYRFALAIESVAPEGGVAQAMPSAADHAPRPGDATVVPEIAEYVTGHVLAGETARRAAARAFEGFSALVRRLEDNAQNPDFWAGIAAPG